MANRIFTFGCSFTKYIWPTWAEIMYYDTEIPLYNYGVSGLGNVGIHHRILEADIRHKFTPDDLILVLWSSWNREDRFMGNRWLAVGNVLNNHIYDKEFIKNHWSIENNIVKNSTSIISANKMYNIDFQGHIVPIKKDSSSLMNKAQRALYSFYEPLIDDSVHFCKTMPQSKSYFSNNIMDDGHPDLLEHLDFLETHVYKKLNRTLKPETKFLINEVQASLNSSVDPKLTRQERMIQAAGIITTNFNLPFTYDQPEFTLYE